MIVSPLKGHLSQRHRQPAGGDGPAILHPAGENLFYIRCEVAPLRRHHWRWICCFRMRSTVWLRDTLWTSLWWRRSRGWKRRTAGWRPTTDLRSRGGGTPQPWIQTLRHCPSLRTAANWRGHLLFLHHRLSSVVFLCLEPAVPPSGEHVRGVVCVCVCVSGWSCAFGSWTKDTWFTQTERLSEENSTNLQLFHLLTLF